MIRRSVLVLVCGWVLLAGAAPAAEDQFFDSNGVKIHYKVEGKGEPVLLIHGFTGWPEPVDAPREEEVCISGSGDN